MIKVEKEHEKETEWNSCCYPHAFQLPERNNPATVCRREEGPGDRKESQWRIFDLARTVRKYVASVIISFLHARIRIKARTHIWAKPDHQTAERGIAKSDKNCLNQKGPKPSPPDL